ncbi:MAG: hypothetical protein DRJ64_01100 [Thermoprotei archaeon]|nr:MAG: hypothetical protein DRJ64_01100 [Thermoprotei archaeon]
MNDCYNLKITAKEWQFIRSAQYSESLTEISKNMNTSYVTVYRLYTMLKSKASFNYIVDFKKMNLVHITLFFNGYQKIENIHPLTVSIRKVFGVKPYYMVSAFVPYIYREAFVKSFDNEPVKTIIGYETYKWKPDSPLSLYLESSETIIPVFNVFYEKYDNLNYPVDNTDYTNKAPDKIDIALIFRKYKHPFEPLTRSVRHIRKHDPDFPLISKQALSYHYKKHIKKLWLYNSIIPLYDSYLVPFRIFYFEGKEAPILARILINLPTFYLTSIDTDKAILVGQPPCHIFENIYRIISMFDVEMPLGDLVMSNKNMKSYLPPLWHFTENNRWIWKDIKIKILQPI